MAKTQDELNAMVTANLKTIVGGIVFQLAEAQTNNQVLIQENAELKAALEKTKE